MKLRIRGNSIRVRVTRSELVRFGSTGRLVDAVEFGPSSPNLLYELIAKPDTETPEATFRDNCLSISIPPALADAWIESDEVGIEAAQEIGEDKFLRILVQKDFSCLEPRSGEDESDAFANPESHANAEQC